MKSTKINFENVFFITKLDAALTKNYNNKNWYKHQPYPAQWLNYHWDCGPNRQRGVIRLNSQRPVDFDCIDSRTKITIKTNSTSPLSPFLDRIAPTMRPSIPDCRGPADWTPPREHPHKHDPVQWRRSAASRPECLHYRWDWTTRLALRYSLHSQRPVECSDFPDFGRRYRPERETWCRVEHQLCYCSNE